MNNTSDHSDYEYVNENEIDDELKCIICKQPLQSPVSLSKCNHTFCKKCIKKWLHQNPTCPTCRQHTSRRLGFGVLKIANPAYVPINTRIVVNQLDRLLVRCLLCGETNIQRCHLKNHENICLKRRISYPSGDIKSTWEGSRDTLLIHMNSCIIDELKNELKLAQTIQTELKNSVDILERKVVFLLNYISNDQLMIQNCTNPTNECKHNGTDGSNQNIRFICSICNEQIQREQISLQAFSGDCICRSCVKSQYSDPFRTNHVNEQYSFSDTED